MADIKIPKQFTVYRSRWFRGKGDMYSRLLRKRDKKMCCVGFLAEACGFAPKDIEDRPTLAEIKVDVPAEMKNLAQDIMNNTLIYCTNDRTDMSEEERERALRQQFRQLGIRLIIKD